jgi:hypothetical protein
MRLRKKRRRTRDRFYGGVIADHLASEFTHAHIPGNKDLNRVHPGTRSGCAILTSLAANGTGFWKFLVEPAANMVDFMNGCCEQASWPQAAPSMTGSVALHKDVT